MKPWWQVATQLLARRAQTTLELEAIQSNYSISQFPITKFSSYTTHHLFIMYDPSFFEKHNCTSGSMNQTTGHVYPAVSILSQKQRQSKHILNITQIRFHHWQLFDPFFHQLNMLCFRRGLVNKWGRSDMSSNAAHSLLKQQRTTQTKRKSYFTSSQKMHMKHHNHNLMYQIFK